MKSTACCLMCRCEITIWNLQKHLNRKTDCKTRPLIFEGLTQDKNGNIQCPYCPEVKRPKGIDTHIWRMHGEGRAHQPRFGVRGGSAWNKGKTKHTDKRLLKAGMTVSKTLKSLYALGKIRRATHTPEFKEELALRQSLHNSGGRCKWFMVDGVYVQGTWERDLAKHFSSIGVHWRKLTKSDAVFYKIDGKRHPYTSDFYLPDQDVFLEIKGFFWGNDKEKMRSVLAQNLHLSDSLAIIELKLFKQLLQTTERDEAVRLILDNQKSSLTCLNS